MTESKTGMSFSRRNFIKGAAVLTAAGTLAGCSPQTENLSETGGEVAQEVPETQIFSGVCRGNCFCGCPLDIHVRDGQVVRTTAKELPDPRYNRICPKGLSHVGRIYSADRLQYPMRRVGERGAGEFERISWDEAIDEIAEKWLGYIDQYGSQSIGIARGSGNYAVASGITPIGGFIFRFMNLLGVTQIEQNIDQGLALGNQRIVGGTGNEITDMENAKTIICWGANPAVSQTQNMHFIMEAKEKGSRYIVIDPSFNMNAAKADWYIPIKGGTDGALALGIIKILFDNQWIDEDYVRANTNAGFLVNPETNEMLNSGSFKDDPTDEEKAAYLVWDEAVDALVPYTEASSPALRAVAPVNGIAVKTAFEIVQERVADYSVARSSELTGVPEDTIRELARIYHEDGPVYTYSAFGFDRYQNGHYSIIDMHAVSLLSGNFGKPGAGSGNWNTALATNYNAASVKPVGADGNPVNAVYDCVPIKELLGIIKTGTYLGQPRELKSVFFFEGNHMVNMGLHDYTVEWVKALDFVVVADINMTETARYADILLPAAHWFEQEDMFQHAVGHPFCLFQEKVMDPLYESKPDFEIIKLLSDKLGIGEYMDFTVEEYLAHVIDTDAARERGFTVESLKEQKAIRTYPEGPIISAANGVFGTKTGKAMLYNDAVAPVPTPPTYPTYDVGQSIDLSKERSLYWEPPLEVAADSATRQTYPFHAISERIRSRTHSQWWEVDYMKEIDAEPIVRLNPLDAAELGVVDGDDVRLYNDRGYVVLKVSIASNYAPKTCGITRGFNADEHIEGHIQSLSSNEYNQICTNQPLNDVAVAIEKA